MTNIQRDAVIRTNTCEDISAAAVRDVLATELNSLGCYGRTCGDSDAVLLLMMGLGGWLLTF